MKSLFVNSAGEVHFGTSAPEGYEPGGEADMERALSQPGSRKFWRCTVCNDLSISAQPPAECPTCFVWQAYIEIGGEEFRKIYGVLK